MDTFPSGVSTKGAEMNRQGVEKHFRRNFCPGRWNLTKQLELPDVPRKKVNSPVRGRDLRSRSPVLDPLRLTFSTLGRPLPQLRDRHPPDFPHDYEPLLSRDNPLPLLLRSYAGVPCYEPPFSPPMTFAPMWRRRRLSSTSLRLCKRKKIAKKYESNMNRPITVRPHIKVGEGEIWEGGNVVEWRWVTWRGWWSGSTCDGGRTFLLGLRQKKQQKRRVGFSLKPISIGEGFAPKSFFRHIGLDPLSPFQPLLHQTGQEALPGINLTLTKQIWKNYSTLPP